MTRLPTAKCDGSDSTKKHLAQFLVLRVLVAGVARHASLGRHAGILGSLLLLLLHVVLVVQRGLRRHVLRRHLRGGHAAGLALRDLGVRVLGRLDGLPAVNAVSVRGRLGRVQAGLQGS